MLQDYAKREEARKAKAEAATALAEEKLAANASKFAAAAVRAEGIAREQQKQQELRVRCFSGELYCLLPLRVCCQLDKGILAHMLCDCTLAEQVEESRLRYQKKQAHIARMMRRQENMLSDLEQDLEQKLARADASNMEKRLMDEARYVIQSDRCDRCAMVSCSSVHNPRFSARSTICFDMI
eukprot:SAG31_NODE_5038_length_2783_cov_1.986215_2_plen_182_part_00